MIHIQSQIVNDRKLPHHFDASCAMFGAIESALDFRLTSYEEIDNYNFIVVKNNLFVGSVEFMRKVFSKVGKETVGVPKNSNRESRIMTLGEAKAEGNLFIKPYGDIKLFTGFVLDGTNNMSISNISDDTEVLAYSVMDNIISEFRCYIHNHRVVDIRNYSGDLFSSPNKDYLESVILENRDTFPVAYTIDIGILESGENFVVEFNDMWAIGNYGIENELYLRLLKDRYFEIVRG